MFPYLKLLFINCFLLIVLAELLFCSWAYWGDLKIELPVYSLENTQTFWYDLHPAFGTCHLPNATFRHKKSCFDVTYTSNQYGFRDVTRQRKSSARRVICLGDSFIEGVGVDSEQRLTNLLAKKSGTPHLNFGMAGNFGTTQYWQTYRSLASQFTHDAVLVGILPANDFIEDDLAISKKGMRTRYRPYLIGDYPDYELVYYRDSIQHSELRVSTGSFIKKLLKNFTYSYNGFRYFKTLLQQKVKPQQPEMQYEELPGYFNYTTAQLNRVKFALAEIRKLAGTRPVAVFTIPNYRDVIVYREHGSNPLAVELGAFCRKQNITYLDLLQQTTQLTLPELATHFLACDGHWSPQGNAFAQQAIYCNLAYYQ